MTRIQNCVIGSPLGFKVNISSELKLDDIVDAFSVYHGGKYVIGKDTSFIDTPHYHIHFLCVKDVTMNALKVFRTTLGKKITYLTKADKIYSGQDIPSADSERWFAYALKEEIVKIEGISHTPTLEVLRKSAFENKRQNKVYSEKKTNELKEKKDRKAKMFEYVKMHIENYDDKNNELYYGNEKLAFQVAVVDYFKSVDMYGAMKSHFLNQYWLEWKSKHSANLWTTLELVNYINNR